MDIHFKNPSKDPADTLPDRARVRLEAKLRKLMKFANEGTYETQVFIDIQKESGANTSDRMWRATINFDLPGNRFNASQTANTPEKAADIAANELKRELRRANSKTRDVARRKASFWKSFKKSFGT